MLFSPLGRGETNCRTSVYKAMFFHCLNNVIINFRIHFIKMFDGKMENNSVVSVTTLDLSVLHTTGRKTLKDSGIRISEIPRD